MNKRIIWIVLISIVSGVGIFFAWLFILNQPQGEPLALNQILPSLPSSGSQETSSPQTIVNPKSKHSLVTQKSVLSAALNRVESKIFFYDGSGQIYSINLDGSGLAALNQSPASNLVQAIWSKDGAKLAQITSDSFSNLYYTYLNLETNQERSLGNLATLAFSPDSKKIARQEIEDSSLNNFSTSNLSGKDKRVFSNLNFRDVNLYWPSANTLALTSKPSAKVFGSLWTFNLQNGGLKKILTYSGLETLWAPLGDKILYSYYDKTANAMSLNLADISASEQKKSSFGILTFTSKCAWSQNNTDVYCAVPRGHPEDPNLPLTPDDYYQKKSFAQDDIWKINTRTGEKILIFSNINDAQNLFLSPNEDMIFYISRPKSRLYRINLQ